MSTTNTRRKPRAATQPAAALAPGSPVTRLPGIGKAAAESLERLNIRTLADLLYHLPFRYEDYSRLVPIAQLAVNERVTVTGTITSSQVVRLPGRRSITRVTIQDATGSVEAHWFNQPYLLQQLRQGAEVIVSGLTSLRGTRVAFIAPDWEFPDRDLLNTGRIVPVYHLTKGIGQHAMRRWTHSALTLVPPQLPEALPEALRSTHALLPIGKALAEVHYPSSDETLRAARARLIFEEFLYLQLGMLQRRAERTQAEGRPVPVDDTLFQRLQDSLPFELTNAQKRVTGEILADLARPHPMSRLLQGDVGSGKTVVAAAAVLSVVSHGLQAAVMAPTSILAEQHLASFRRLLAPFPEVRCELLVGSMSEAAKAEVRRAAADGSAQVLVGTHALLEDTVRFNDLGLVVVDEQHRFGVGQRAGLRAKGGEAQPHLLAMSATPIPRSLALTLYGDLDISLLDELPAERQEILTRVRDASSYERIYAFIRSQVAEGRQAFIICPRVDDEDAEGDTKAALQEHRRLQKEVFPDLNLGLLHGRMKADDKERIMQAMQRHELDILVATSVVEVGIDIPNASVILIEGADRFGLAQLHQMRGRVGRGVHKSYCILMIGDTASEALERLQTLERTRDGLEIAQMDLELRGPGDMIGTRQHGLPELRAASLSDLPTLERARSAAQALLEDDPALCKPEHIAISAKMHELWHTSGIQI